MMKEEDKIELYSEELQDILGAIPHWILRWGILTLGSIVLLLIIGSAIFKYPDVISADITLTGTTPPAVVIARTSGRLDELLVNDNDIVLKGDQLAIVENPINTYDILYLRSFIDSLNISNSPPLPRKNLKLGNIQSLYSTFYTVLYEYEEFERLSYYPTKIDMTRKRIKDYEKQYQNLIRHEQLARQQLALSQKQFERDSILLTNKVISMKDFELAQSQHLQAQMSYENIRISIDNLHLQITQLEESLRDIEQQYVERKNSFTTQLLNTSNQLRAEIDSWELNYVLISPISGTVSFTKFWVKNQNIKGGEDVFTIVPTQEPQLIGKANLPIARSGKAEVGQKVNIRFDNFPDQEYGMVKGIVKNISLVPTLVENGYCYTIEVGFPEGLLTTYGKKLPFLPEMKGQADVITDDITLLQRFFMPLRKILLQGTDFAE